jgi:DNA-binding SARP family transcriptional activator
MYFRVLGSLEVAKGNRPVDFGGPMRRKLVARLLVAAPEPVPAATLQADLWDGHPAAAAGATLRSHLAGVRSAMGKKRVVSSASGYRLEVLDDEVDAQRFRRCLRSGVHMVSEGRCAEALTVVQDAVDLWRGPALEGFAGSDWASAYVAGLEDERVQAAVCLLYSHLALGMDMEAAALARASLATWPEHDDFLVGLMTALYKCGRQTEALRAFQSRRNALRERGLVPSPQLLRAEEAVLTHDPALMLCPPAHFASFGSAGAPGSGAEGVQLGLTDASRAARPPALGPWALRPVARQVFVGRHQELLSFEAALADALGGELSVSVVAGEPGIGKTALLAEMAERAEQRGLVVLYGGVTESAGLPLLPFRSALRDFLARTANIGDRLGRHAEELVRLVPEVGKLVPGLPAPLSSAPEVERWQLFEAVTAWLASAGDGKPAVLLLDDVQWADPATLSLLQHLLAHPTQRGAAVVLAYRSTEACSSLLSLIAALHARAGTKFCELGGLSIDETALVAARATQNSCVLESGEVWRLSAGNPFFIHQLLSTSAGAGYPERRLPPSVVQIVTQRVDRLGPEVASTLSMASLIGVEFDLGILAASLQQDEQRVLGAVEQAGRAALTEETAVDCWRFCHDIVRQALAATWSVSASSRAQAKIATATATAAQPSGNHAAAPLQHHLAGSRADADACRHGADDQAMQHSA